MSTEKYTELLKEDKDFVNYLVKRIKNEWQNQKRRGQEVDLKQFPKFSDMNHRGLAKGLFKFNGVCLNLYDFRNDFNFDDRLNTIEFSDEEE